MYQYKIYLFTFPNGKKYCGYTSQENIQNRWRGGAGYKKCPLVWRAIQKYGWDNIKKEIIFSFPTVEQALKKEQEIIQKYQLTDSNYGYNLDVGGKPGGSSHLTEQGKRNISQAHKLLWQDPSYRKKMSQAFKKVPHKPHSEATKQKISAAKMGNVPSNRVAVLQLDKNSLNVIAQYESATAAAIAVGADETGCSNILNVCKNKRKSAYGYTWRFYHNG